MKVDARPFFKVSTVTGTAKCLRPEFNARTVGIGATEGTLGTIATTATHTLMVFAPMPTDLNIDTVVTINDTVPAGRYRVLQVGIQPYGADIYLAADPAQGRRPYQVGTGPLSTQRLPYVDIDS